MSHCQGLQRCAPPLTSSDLCFHLARCSLLSCNHFQLCHGWQAIWDANLWDHPDSFCYAPFFFSLVGTMLLELLLQLVVKLEIDGLRVRVLGDIFNPTSGDSDK